MPDAFTEMARQYYCPRLGEIATYANVPLDTVIATVLALRDAGELVSIVWDEPSGNHDTASDDLPVILAALGK